MLTRLEAFISGWSRVCSEWWLLFSSGALLLLVASLIANKELTRTRNKSDAPSRSSRVCQLEFRVGRGISGQAHWQMCSNGRRERKTTLSVISDLSRAQEDRGIWGWAWRCSALCQLDCFLSPPSPSSRRGGVLVNAEVPGPRPAPMYHTCPGCVC